MPDEILSKLDELKAGQEELKAGQQQILGRLGTLEGKVDALEGKLNTNYQLLVDLQRSSNDSFELVLGQLPSTKPRALRSTG